MLRSLRVGLRDRKREQLRERLIEAALELFTERGFEATTIDEIAEAAGVARRTYFRYFRSKEDVVSAWVDASSDVAARVSARPSTESPIAAATAVIASELELYGTKPQRLAAVWLLFEKLPVLRAHYLGRMDRLRQEIAKGVAVRLGEAPRAPVPTLIGALVAAAIPVVIDGWIEDGSTGSLGERFRAAIAALETVIVAGSGSPAFHG